MIDLHLHTTFSDGILSPESLVELAHKRGVKIFSITDHDCLDAIPLVKEKASSLGMTLVPGVELNTDAHRQEIHILGYDFKINDPAFQEKLVDQRESRDKRLREMLHRLLDLGVLLDETRVLQLAGHGSVGRPHLALALIEKQYVKTVQEAFDKYLSYGKPAWVPRKQFTAIEAIQLILDAGGMPVLAHPQRGGKTDLESLVEAGLQGIEVFYPTHSESDVQELLSAAKKYNLFVTAGSDFHGINPGEKGPGSVDVPERFIQAFERMLNERWRGK